MTLFQPESDEAWLRAAYSQSRVAQRMTFEQALADPSVKQALCLQARNQRRQRSKP